MLNNSQRKILNATIDNIGKNTHIKELLQNVAFVEFLTLQSVLFEKYIAISQDESVDDEKRLRALELLKLIQSTFNYFENYQTKE
ncbi:hypothetical protein [Campylobacter majalis]|uniref:hypothetical protein n=1 Tax=Campylobacter majalis TaxID=2790656 RepID=UPI003D69F16C